MATERSKGPLFLASDQYAVNIVDDEGEDQDPTMEDDHREGIENLWEFLDDPLSSVSAMVYFGLSMFLLILYYVFIFIEPLIKNEPNFYVFYILYNLFFILEFVIKIVCAPRVFAFLFRFYSLLDILILVIYSVGFGYNHDLSSEGYLFGTGKLYLLITFRATRILLLFKYFTNSSIVFAIEQCFIKCFILIEVCFVLILCFGYIFGVILYYLDTLDTEVPISSVFYGIILVVQVFTSVGLGDFTPKGEIPILFTIVVILGSLIIVGIVASAISVTFEANAELIEEMQKNFNEINVRIRGQVIKGQPIKNWSYSPALIMEMLNDIIVPADMKEVMSDTQLKACKKKEDNLLTNIIRYVYINDFEVYYRFCHEYNCYRNKPNLVDESFQRFDFGESRLAHMRTCLLKVMLMHEGTFGMLYYMAVSFINIISSITSLAKKSPKPSTPDIPFPHYERTPWLMGLEFSLIVFLVCDGLLLFVVHPNRLGYITQPVNALRYLSNIPLAIIFTVIMLNGYFVTHPSFVNARIFFYPFVFFGILRLAVFCARFSGIAALWRTMRHAKTEAAYFFTMYITVSMGFCSIMSLAEATEPQNDKKYQRDIRYSLCFCINYIAGIGSGDYQVFTDTSRVYYIAMALVCVIMFPLPMCLLFKPYFNFYNEERMMRADHRRKLQLRFLMAYRDSNYLQDMQFHKAICKNIELLEIIFKKFEAPRKNTALD